MAPSLRTWYFSALIFIFGIAGSLLLCSCRTETSRQATVRFRVELYNVTRAEHVYLSGSTERLGRWKPDGCAMEKSSDSVWTASVQSAEGEHIEFKVNAGSWSTEALDSAHQRFTNIQLDVLSDTTVTVRVYGWFQDLSNGRTVLSAARFTPGQPALLLDGNWKYMPCDSPQCADAAFNDSAWRPADSYMRWLNDSIAVSGTIWWFRFRMAVDSSLWNQTLALSIGQLGASEIYYNGRFLYSFGVIGSNQASYAPTQNRTWKSLRVEPKRDQVIAVRYSNREWKEQLRLGFSPGFVVSLNDLNTVFERGPDQLRTISARQMFFSAIPFILFILHLFLYAFYPARRENLFYAFSLLGFAGITYFGYQRFISTDPGEIILWYRLNALSMPVAIMFGVLTGYAASGDTLPKRTRVFVVLFVAACAIAIIDPLGISQTANYIFFGFTMLDLIFTSRKGRTAENWKGRLIVLVGFILLVVFVVIQLLVDYDILPVPFGERQTWVYGLIAFIVSMSLYLSYNFAALNKNLVRQLETVKQLSLKTIEQEKAAAKLELSRRLEEAENERKAKEFESARRLQMSLLPTAVPSHESLEIGCVMKTATEVGGDYYDFFTGKDGALTAVIGDATGHGLKAGMMVMLSKGLLNMLSGETEPAAIMTEANRAIKEMNLNQLTMCMAIVKISGRTVSYSSADIPPLLIYRKDTRTIEHMLLKAMPLGAFLDFPYGKIESTVRAGDVILMMSDGLSEMFDARGEMFGIDRVAEALQETAGRTAQEIVQTIREKGMAWAGGTPLADDMTIVVIKIV